MRRDGAPLAYLVKAWTATRHAKPGTPEAEICSYARAEITAIGSRLNTADEEAGRPSAVQYVETLRKSGLTAGDRSERCKANVPLRGCVVPGCPSRKRTPNRDWMCKSHRNRTAPR